MKTTEKTSFNVLFVCLGNICRSPLAEGLFQKKINDKGLQKIIKTDSCGTSNLHVGELPDPRTRKNASSHGLTLTHRGRQLIEKDFTTFDLMVFMDDSNLANLEKEKPQHSSVEICKMGDFYTVSKGDNIPDPWYGGEEGFETVYQMLDKCTDELLLAVEERII